VIALTKAIGMEPLAFSLRGEAGRVSALGARPAGKDEILAEADVVTLHLRLQPDTRGFLGRRELGSMKRSALLVNTARGALVERDALLEALAQGRIAGAALDVFHDEPLKPADPLLTRDNVVLSPHNAGQTPEVIRDGLLRAVHNIEAFLAGRPTDVVVAPVK
jgi:D-3-phosphoglycerate dehydrogenase